MDRDWSWQAVDAPSPVLPRPVEPKDVPDFYGYGSDIVVNLDTGGVTVRDGMSLPRAGFGTLWAVLLVLFVGLPMLLWDIARGKRPWDKGQMMEWDIRNDRRPVRQSRNGG